MVETVVTIIPKEDFAEQGFYSKSYLAFDERLQREVAVKDINLKNLKSEAEFETYFTEAKLLSTSSHPRVLPVYYVGIDNREDKKIPRIVTKYLKNGSLNTLLDKYHSDRVTLPLHLSMKFAHEIIQGMIHLHALDILHLDLKASNVFIGDDGKLVIADFGQAKFIKDEVIIEAQDLYPAITPPEGFRKKAIDITADIYQFGVLLYSLFNYKVYRSEIDNNYKINTNQLNELFNNPEKRNEDQFVEFQQNIKRMSKDVREGTFPNRNNYHYNIPKGIVEIVNKCMNIDVLDRYNNFYEIQEELNCVIIPKNIEDLCISYDNENEILFKKENIQCKISVEKNEKDRYDLNPRKGNQNKPGKARENVTENKFRKEIFKIIEEL